MTMKLSPLREKGQAYGIKVCVSKGTQRLVGRSCGRTLVVWFWMILSLDWIRESLESLSKGTLTLVGRRDDH